MKNTAADIIYTLGQVAEKRAPNSSASYQLGYLQTLLTRILGEIPEEVRQKFIDTEVQWLDQLMNKNG